MELELFKATTTSKNAHAFDLQAIFGSFFSLFTWASISLYYGFEAYFNAICFLNLLHLTLGCFLTSDSEGGSGVGGISWFSAILSCFSVEVGLSAL